MLKWIKAFVLSGVVGFGLSWLHPTGTEEARAAMQTDVCPDCVRCHSQQCSGGGGRVECYYTPGCNTWGLCFC